MSNPRVTDSGGYYVGTYDSTNGIIETEYGENMTVDGDNMVFDSDGNCVGYLGSDGHIR